MRSPVRQGRCHRLTRAFYPPQKHDPIFIHGGAPKAHGVYCRRFPLPDRSSERPQTRLKLTEQADLSLLRSEAGQASRLVSHAGVIPTGLAVVCVGLTPNLQIVICRCQDCGSNVSRQKGCPE